MIYKAMAAQDQKRLVYWVARVAELEGALRAIMEETRIVSIVPAGFPDSEFPQEIQDLRHIRAIAEQALAAGESGVADD